MKKIAVIPARYNSARLPGKMLAKLGDKTLIETTYLNIQNMNLFDEVLVATDNKDIFDLISSHNGLAVMTRNDHKSGTDRIAEVVAPLDVDIVVNVQGDEPFMHRKPLENLLSAFSDESVDVATLKMRIIEKEDIENPNNVKVVTTKDDFAMYFSRSVIPYPRKVSKKTKYFQHIGVYAFRKQAILDFAQLPMRNDEKAEKIECLRFLEYGMKIKVVKTKHRSIGIDTQEDLDKANNFLKDKHD